MHKKTHDTEALDTDKGIWLNEVEVYLRMS